jgi:hypothetical protein
VALVVERVTDRLPARAPLAADGCRGRATQEEVALVVERVMV